MTPKTTSRIPPPVRERVAIIGGGCAAMTTAWELTQPELKGRFDVTVYQMGWRLGGKGASGRGANGRIEEHGLHLWMGHYDNAFRIMRDCYAELDRDPATSPMATWRDAFVPDPYVGLANRDANGTWRRMMAYFPPLPGLPGDPHDNTLPTTVTGYVSRSIRLVVALIESATTSSESSTAGRGANGSNGASGEQLQDAVVRFLRYGQVVTLTVAIQALHTLQAILDVLTVFPDGLLNEFVDSLCDAVRSLLDPLLEEDTESQYLWEIIDIVLAQIRGSFRFGLMTDPRGFDVINDYDSRDWLAENGASDRALDSAFMRGLYDLAFAYQNGDPERPGMAAGQGLRGGMRMFFGYRGSLFWKMQAGMGDVMFAPMFEALVRRGVRFEFFHKLTNVGLSDDTQSPHVTTLDFDVQATTSNGAPYQPLVDVRGLPCWPAAPLWDQLQNGTVLRKCNTRFESAWDQACESRKTLRVSEDFDFVVLGVSLGTIPLVCKEFLARDQRWRDMVTHVKTVPTQCFQVWLHADLQELGWEEDPPNLSGFVEPFDTWADMTHLAKAEDWPSTPQSIGYFCNVLPALDGDPDLSDPDFPERASACVRNNAIRFLDRDIVELWPNSQVDQQFNWSLINHGDLNPDKLTHPFDSQFWIANVNPSDRYVLSLPGTIQYRISPLDETYDNLTITGDWTDCSFNFGCVEAAVMSGRLAAHALAQFPELEDIYGYDHP